jgi:DNA-binding LacI/PurR family transcriptional regulator/DNA-binding transcriptional regulator YhcF (GntR family)
MQPAKLAEFIESKIKRDHWPEDGVIPGIRELARHFRTSPNTLCAALALLCQKGTLISRGEHRKRYFVAGADGNADAFSKLPLRQDAAQKLSNSIRQDIASGNIDAQGVLPTIKEMAQRYRCNKDTLRKAIVYLQKQGIVARKGRMLYLVLPGGIHGSRSKVFLLGSARYLRDLSSGFPIVSSIDRELARLGWDRPDLRFLSSGHKSPQAVPSEAVAGLIYIAAGRKGEQQGGLSYYPDAPLAVICGAEPKPDIPKMKSVCFIRSDNVLAGRKVGATLARMGHKNAAFFSHVNPQKHAWVKERYNGMVEGFVRGDQSVSFYRCPNRSDARWLEPYREYIHLFRHRLAAQAKAPHELLSEKVSPLFTFMSLLASGENLRSLYENALRKRGTTAWVCANDDLAAMAAYYLSQQGLTLGRDISLVSFDNSPIAYRMDIASYDFDLPAMGRHAVWRLAYPSLMKRQVTMVVEGQLILRSSVGSPKA